MINFFSKKVEIKFEVEAFKGCLEAAALKEIGKKEFSNDSELKEVVMLGDLKKIEPQFKKILENNLMFNVKTSDDFMTSYIICVDGDGDLTKITALITEKLSDELKNLLDMNGQVIRIRKN